MTSEDEYAAAKDRARQTWDSGDFGAIAKLIAAVGEDIVDRVDVAHGEAVLDVACGTGTTTLPAARRGARAHGLDIAPGLLEEARGNAAAEGLQIDFVLGDAEALPWPDASFDVVLSTFGCMFAPHHEVAAAEIARVLKPGGRIGLCCWTPTGRIGGFFRTIAAHLPAPPASFLPPALWGVPDHVEQLFARTSVSPRFDVTSINFRFASPEAAVIEYETKFGPVVMARAAQADDAGRQALHGDLVEFFTRESTTEADGRIAFNAEYLVITGSKSA